jgi:MoxR-like ATPase
MKSFKVYHSKGQPLQQGQIPLYKSPWDGENPANYISTPGLEQAVNVALALGQPLLITGEPGTGKTRLADSIAWKLRLEPLKFYTKTTSTATDLFYHYDALRHFQDVQLNKARPIENYIKCQALGLAILLANPTEDAKRFLPDKFKNKEPVRSVVLIDEIDKAPRDLSNDVLNEIEEMKFYIREFSDEAFTADESYRPIVVMTSNSEKDLPDAFLRRCVYYHIPFPDEETLKEIVKMRFSSDPEMSEALSQGFLDGAISHFYKLRSLNLKKAPATAELLSWLSILRTLNIDMNNLKEKDKERVITSYSVLAKNHNDLKQLSLYIEGLVKAKP